MGAPLHQQKVWRRAFATLLLVSMLTAGCLGVGQNEVARSGDDSGVVHLTVWYTFAAESKEEQVFLESIQGFQELHPNITVDATLIPYDDAVNQFKTAAIGGEAPDLMRLSSDQLGSIGEVRVDGFPLLEDLRPHLTPAERQLYDVQALHASATVTLSTVSRRVKIPCPCCITRPCSMLEVLITRTIHGRRMICWQRLNR